MSINADVISKLDLKQPISVQGDSARPILGVVPISKPASDHISFIRSSQALDRLDLNKVVHMTLVCDSATARKLDPDINTLLIVNDPRLVFLRVISLLFVAPNPTPSIHPSAVVDPTAEIHDSAHIGAGCFVGANCKIGRHCILYQNVTVYSNVLVGNNVVVHSGTVIGSDGFGYERNELGVMEKFPHIGGVVICDDVDIGANNTIDRGTLDDTIVGQGVKIDNHCHIAHNCEIGENTVIIAMSMLAGGVKVGKRVWISPSASILNKVSIGDDATVGIGSVVLGSVGSGVTVMGSPARRISG